MATHNKMDIHSNRNNLCKWTTPKYPTRHTLQLLQLHNLNHSSQHLLQTPQPFPNAPTQPHHTLKTSTMRRSKCDPTMSHGRNNANEPPKPPSAQIAANRSPSRNSISICGLSSSIHAGKNSALKPTAASLRRILVEPMLRLTSNGCALGREATSVIPSLSLLHGYSSSKRKKRGGRGRRWTSK